MLNPDVETGDRKILRLYCRPQGTGGSHEKEKLSLDKWGF